MGRRVEQTGDVSVEGQVVDVMGPLIHNGEVEGAGESVQEPHE